MFDIEVLIDLVKARPSLYDSNLLDYKSKPICNILWREVGDAMQKDVNQCRRVWSSLRSSYARHLQNMENNEKGINQKKKAEWYLADKMSFLNEFMTRTPRDRKLTLNPNESNNTTFTFDDNNSKSFTNFECRSENNCDQGDNHSIITIKSEDHLSEMTLSAHSLEDRINEEYNDNVEEVTKETQVKAEIPSPIKTYHLKKCRVELSSKDQNILFQPKPIQREKTEAQSPKQDPIPKRLKISTPTSKEEPKPSTTVMTMTTTTTPPQQPPPLRETKKKEEEFVDIKAREDSILLFFESILFDLRQLPDRKLRMFKQDILQDLNTFLDEDEDLD